MAGSLQTRKESTQRRANNMQVFGVDERAWALIDHGGIPAPGNDGAVLSRRAADQLVTNSVVQDHYGDVLQKLGRVQEAIDRWTQALAGDGDSIDVAAIQRKIRAAREQLPRR